MTPKRKGKMGEKWTNFREIYKTKILSQFNTDTLLILYIVPW